MNTDDKRDEIRRQKNKPWYVKCPWLEKELLEALGEIDRQAAWFKERDDDPELFIEERLEIERRIKGRCVQAAVLEMIEIDVSWDDRHRVVDKMQAVDPAREDRERISTVRKAAHAGYPLDGSDAWVLEDELHQAERKIDRTKEAIEALIKEMFPIATVWRRELLGAIAWVRMTV